MNRRVRALIFCSLVFSACGEVVGPPMGAPDAANVDAGVEHDAGRTEHNVRILLRGSGTGSIEALTCSVTQCEGIFAPGTMLTLVASANAGALFTGWSGAPCDGRSGICDFVVQGDVEMVATFERAFELRLSTAGDGEGRVTGPDLDCPTRCSALFVTGTVVELTAVPAELSHFSRWGGSCSGATCSLTMDADREVSAVFELDRLSLAVSLVGDGEGRVIADSGALDCPGVCSDEYITGTQVTLSAEAQPDAIFAGWGGDCSGIGACVVTVDRARAVSASFRYRSRLATGVGHTCALSPAGSVRCWGSSYAGQLGYGNTTKVGDGLGPTIMEAGDVPVGSASAQISARFATTCALSTAGAVRCWGGNGGQLGYNNTAAVGDGVGPTILQAGDVPIGATVSQVSVGDGHVCALLTSGAVRCWGRNASGQLGYNHVNTVGDGVGPSILAAGDVPLGGPASQIAAGGTHTCAVLATTGAVRCWGRNHKGQLGYNNMTNVADGMGPTIIAAGDVSLDTPATQIATGTTHTCALLASGTIRCWGENANGELGYDNTTNVGDGVGPSTSAAGDVPVGGASAQISAGTNFTCARLAENGEVRCWGNNVFGQLGYNNTTRVGDGQGPTILAVGSIALGSSAREIAAGNNHTCARLFDGAIRCWGSGNDGRLGYNSSTHVADGLGPTIIAAGDVPVF